MSLKAQMEFRPIKKMVMVMIAKQVDVWLRRERKITYTIPFPPTKLRRNATKSC